MSRRPWLLGRMIHGNLTQLGLSAATPSTGLLPGAELLGREPSMIHPGPAVEPPLPADAENLVSGVPVRGTRKARTRNADLRERHRQTPARSF